MSFTRFENLCEIEIWTRLSRHLLYNFLWFNIFPGISYFKKSKKEVTKECSKDISDNQNGNAEERNSRQIVGRLRP